MIVGIDEVGRGCLAGPVAAGAVVLAKPIRGLKDSKLLTRQQREKFDVRIRERALSYGVGWASVEEINQFGMTHAVRLAMHRAVEEVLKTFTAIEQLVVDGSYNYFKDHPLSTVAQAIIKADQTVPAVSAASIIAKVARDLHMIGLAAKYPGFGFDSHVGYATPAHRRALRQLGVTDIHRLNFRQVKDLLGVND